MWSRPSTAVAGSADYDRFVAGADGDGMVDGRMDVPARAGPASAGPGPLRPFGRSPVTADRSPLTIMRLNPAAEIAGQGRA
jgi:hypothetical protein